MKKVFVAVLTLFFSFTNSYASDQDTTIECLVINNTYQQFNFSLSNGQVDTIDKANVLNTSLPEQNNYFLSIKNTNYKDQAKLLPFLTNQPNTTPLFLTITQNNSSATPELKQININNDKVIIINNASDQDFTITIPVKLTKGTIKSIDWLGELTKHTASSTNYYIVNASYTIPAQQIQVIKRPETVLGQPLQDLKATIAFNKSGNKFHEIQNNTSNSKPATITFPLKKSGTSKDMTKAVLHIKSTEDYNAAIFTINDYYYPQYSIHKHEFALSDDTQ